MEGLPPPAPEPLDFAELLKSAAEMGLKPDEFWSLTYREFALYATGYRRRMTWWQRLAALAAAWIINYIPAFKARSAVTPDKLLGGGPAASEHR